eukprot:13710319-Ditylum_brightwellii.AAC.1
MGLQLLCKDRKGNEMPVFVVTAYHPNSKKKTEEFDDFLAAFSLVCDSALDDSILIVGLDANVQLGRNILLKIDNSQSYPVRVTGPFGFHPRSN